MERENKIYFFEAQQIVANAFDMQVSQDALFKDLKDVAEALFGIDETEKQSFTKQLWSNSSLTQILAGGLSGEALLSLLGPVGYAALGVFFTGTILKAKRDRAVMKLTALCTVLFVYERMFWFGTPVITRPIAQRAWIEYFKIYADLGLRVKNGVNAIDSDDWQQILTSVTNHFKHEG